MKLISAVTVCFTTMVILPTYLSGQSFFGEHRHPAYITVEFLKPNYDLETEPTFFTSVAFFSVRLPLYKWVGFKAELPFAHAAWKTDSEDENTFGNPYLGLEIGNMNSPVWGEIGVRFPVAPDDDEENGAAATVGFQTDMVHRIEAFSASILPITGVMNYRYRFPSGLNWLLRTGTIFIHHQSRDEKSGWFLLYSTHLYYEINRFILGGGLAGRKWLTADNGNKPNIFQITLSANVRFGHFIPGIDFKIPLSNELLEGQLDSVIALNLQYVF